MVSAEHVGGTRGSGIVSSAADVLWMRRVGEVCAMCMCLARGYMGGEGGEWMRGFGLNQSCQNRGSVGCVSVFGLRWCGWCRSGVGRGLGPGSGGVVLCLCEMWIWIICVDGRSRYMCIVLGGYLRI